MNYTQSLIKIFQQTSPNFQADWDVPRKQTLVYSTLKKGETAAEEAFHLLNAPLDLLSPWQRDIVRDHRSHSLSVGDVVEVDGEKYLCASRGWIKQN
jgi:hypothetical protein